MSDLRTKIAEPQRGLTRRATLFGGCGLLLSACTASLQDVRYVIRGPEGSQITRAQVDSLPYATVAAKLGRGPRFVGILGKAEGNDLHWNAVSTVLVTRRGRVIRTVGLSANLTRTELVDQDPVSGLVDIEQFPVAARRLVDFGPPYRFNVMVEGVFEEVGRETVEILELQFDTRVFREKCTARDVDWKFTNTYWVDPENGINWKSRQHIHPDLPALDLDILKPPSLELA